MTTTTDLRPVDGAEGPSSEGDADAGSAPRTATNTDPANTTTQEATMSETPQTFQVTGMTCGHCASAVTDELKQLPGVTGVSVDLVAGGTSTVQVTGSEPLDNALVSTALEAAGDYTLA